MREQDKTKPVLITGGAGFLGTNIAAALASRGDSVLIYDNLSRAHVGENVTWLKEQFGDRVHLHLGDIRDSESVDAVVAVSSAVIHLAGQVAVTTSIDAPQKDFEVNAAGTLNVLEAVRLHAPQAPFLFASTNKVYGKLLDGDALKREQSRYVPRSDALATGFDENTPLSFHSPYGCSKGAADQYVLDYARTYGLKATVFRMSCLYGPHQFGCEDQGWVAHFLISALDRRGVTIYGDGLQVRDVLFVEDAVAAYLTALSGAFAGRVFNLGGGPANTLSLLELVAWIEQAMGERLPLAFDSWRQGDQAWYVSDTRAFEQAAGWRARTSVHDGLSHLLRWLNGDAEELLRATA